MRQTVKRFVGSFARERPLRCPVVAVEFLKSPQGAADVAKFIKINSSLPGRAKRQLSTSVEKWF